MVTRCRIDFGIRARAAAGCRSGRVCVPGLLSEPEGAQYNVTGAVVTPPPEVSRSVSRPLRRFWTSAMVTMDSTFLDEGAVTAGHQRPTRRSTLLRAASHAAAGPPGRPGQL